MFNVLQANAQIHITQNHIFGVLYNQYHSCGVVYKTRVNKIIINYSNNPHKLINLL